MNSVKVTTKEELKQLFSQVKESSHKKQVIAWTSDTMFSVFEGGCKVKTYSLRD